MKLKDKVAIVTGGARGIGKATAELFVENGAKVYVWDRAEMEVEEGLVCMSVDVTNYEKVTEAVQRILEKEGKIDILVNNAGITKDKSLLKMTQEDWHQVIDINLTGVFNCTKAVVQSMVERKFGRILCASSVVGITGNFGQTNYVATKSALIGMVKTWAKELAKHNITANAVAPGFIKTDMTDLIPEEVKLGIESTIPAKRMGQPIDIANAYLFLASDDAAYINGQCLSVNGGMA
ncbi:MAG: 3-oxoacyl-[acyl-carrier-protein] reductase [Spirosomataceae bacterium]